MASPAEGQRLYAYLAVSEIAVSTALFIEEEGKQKPVFYASRMLLDAETRYSTAEKRPITTPTAAPIHGILIVPVSHTGQCLVMEQCFSNFMTIEESIGK